MEKIIFITPSLSNIRETSILLKKITAISKEIDIYIIEYEARDNNKYKSNIIDIISSKKIITLNNHSISNINKIINNILPDIISFEDIPERFMNSDEIFTIFNKDRTYNIHETTYIRSEIEIYYKPDLFIFYNKNLKKIYDIYGVPIEIINFPYNYIEIQNKDTFIEHFNLDKNVFNILVVGVHQYNNQQYIYDLANQFENYKVNFIFVEYEQIRVFDLPKNSKYLGVVDIELLYAACDLLIYQKNDFAIPIEIINALSNNLPIFNNSDFDEYNYKILTNIDNNILETKNKILRKFNIKSNYDTESYKKILNSVYNMKIPISREIMGFDFDINEKINLSLLDGISITINDKYDSLFSDKNFIVSFIDIDSGNILHRDTIKSGYWTKPKFLYYVNWKVEIKNNNNIIYEYSLDLDKKNVYIEYHTNSLGDNIAFIPYVEEFRKKHNCNVFVTSKWSNIFKNTYKNINFVDSVDNISIFAYYKLGIFNNLEENHKNKPYSISLQQVASDILGIEYCEIRPNLNSDIGYKPISDKYICLAEFSTANLKHWHYPTIDSNIGWQMVVDYLNEQGYKVMVISLQKTKLKNIIDHTGDYPIEQRINELRNSEFLISVSSGLSWLSWAVGKKTVMVSGFTNPYCEFKEDNIRVINEFVCNSCFNDEIFNLEEFKSDWNYCPRNKNTPSQFICSLAITPEFIVNEMINKKIIKNPKDFNFKNKLNQYLNKKKQTK